MKKILTLIIGMAAGTALVHAQGFIEFTATGNTANIETNTSVSTFAGGSGNGGVGGKTYTAAQDAGAYDYVLLFDASTPTLTDSNSAAGPDWTLMTVNGGGQLIGTSGNLAGTMTGNGGSSGIAVNVAAGTTVSVMLVGWSANLGSAWGGVGGIESQLAGDTWSGNGYFGETAVSTTTPFSSLGAGDPTIITGMFPISSLTMDAVMPSISPEPTTLALAGLGGLSMLFLRRRKS